MLPFLSAAFAAGITLAARIAVPVTFLTALAVAAFAASIVLHSRKKPAAAVLLFLFLLCGMLSYQVALQEVHAPLQRYIGRDGHYFGSIHEVLPADGEGAAFILRLEGANVSAHEEKANGLIRVATYTAVRFTPAYGQRVAIRGVPLQPLGRRNPGGFSYAAYLETVGVGAVMSVPGESVSVLDGSGGHFIQRLAGSARQKTMEALARYLPPGEAGLAAGLLLGNREAVADNTEDAFRRLGISHLLAVSGLHVGFVAAPALFVLSRLFPGRQAVSVCMAALAIVGYVYLTGGKPPVWRAAITFFFALAARALGRERDGLNALATAALLLLSARPLWLFNISFQFSFAATLGILLLSPRLETVCSQVAPVVRGPFCVTAAAQMAVLPLQATYFGLMSILAIPVNLLCVPLVGAVMILGMAGSLAAMLYLPLAAAFLTAALPLLSLLEWLPRLVAQVPFAVVPLPAVPAILWLFYLLALALFASRIPVWPLTGKKVLAALVILNLLCIATLPGPNKGKLQITFLDVGQGLAVHIATPAGRHVLVDAGGGRFDTGANILLPYFRTLGVRDLGLVILTHPHEDHFGGMSTLFEAVPVAAFVSSGDTEDSEPYYNLTAALQKARINAHTVDEGYSMILDGVRLDVLSPPANRFVQGQDSLNNNSLIIRLSYGSFALLITGDAETEAISRLERIDPDVYQASVLQVPHHGSRGAMTSSFLRGCGAEAAVISVGKNTFGHPHPDTLAALAAHGIQCYRTDIHGAVTVYSDGYTWDIRPYLAGGEVSSR